MLAYMHSSSSNKMSSLRSKGFRHVRHSLNPPLQLLGRHPSWLSKSANTARFLHSQMAWLVSPVLTFKLQPPPFPAGPRLRSHRRRSEVLLGSVRMSCSLPLHVAVRNMGKKTVSMGPHASYVGGCDCPQREGIDEIKRRRWVCGSPVRPLSNNACPNAS